MKNIFMFLSLNWLKEFVEIPKTISPEKLGQLLSLHTVEVEKVEPQADKYKNVVFEVDNKSITHRADLWSHYGLARDISAFLNTKFKPIKSPPPPFIKGGYTINVKVEDFKLCPRYMAVGLTGIKVADSPEWLKARLLATGMRPINNIVDVTNHVMLELGQPLHAFDKNFIDKIIVRRARRGEVIETLDSVKRKLEPDMLVIANQTKPVAVAGVMGGASSEISQETTAIIIESANFNFASVRITAQKLALRTESSIRFEKGLDPNLAELGLTRAVELILKICPTARLAGNLADEKKFKLAPAPIDFDLAWLNQRIGVEFSAKPVKRILERLGFGVKEKDGKFSVTIPSWRAGRDISLAEDVMEEVARIYGYNNIAPVMPKAAVAAWFLNQEKILERKIKNILSSGARLTEVYNYSFLSREQLEKLKLEVNQTIKLANPLSKELALLRPSLIPGLLENIKSNQANEERISLYEIGGIFLDREGENNLPFQEKRLGLVLAAAEGHDLFRELKGVIEYLLKSLDLPVVFEPAGSGADIFVGGKKIGQAMELEKGLARSLGIKKQVVMAEISLPTLFSLVKNQPAKAYREPPKYPAAVRDLAFVVNEKILYNNIVKLIKNFSNLIVQAELFDVYQGDKLGTGKKNLAFHIIYQANRTLTSQEVDELQEKLIKHLEKELGAKIRNF